MNISQLNRNARLTRNYVIVGEIVPSQGCSIIIKMGDRHASFRRMKVALKAAKAQWPEAEIHFRLGGVLVTSELAEEWQQYGHNHGYWWPATTRWVKRAAKITARINAQ